MPLGVVAARQNPRVCGDRLQYVYERAKRAAARWPLPTEECPLSGGRNSRRLLLEHMLRVPLESVFQEAARPQVAVLRCAPRLAWDRRSYPQVREAKFRRRSRGVIERTE